MQIYLITDAKMRVHQFIYPDRVWEPGEYGWTSRVLTREDHTTRLATCRGLVKNSISGRRLVSAAPTGPMVEKEEKDDDTIH